MDDVFRIIMIAETVCLRNGVSPRSVFTHALCIQVHYLTGLCIQVHFYTYTCTMYSGSLCCGNFGSRIVSRRDRFLFMQFWASLGLSQPASQPSSQPASQPALCYIRVTCLIRHFDLLLFMCADSQDLWIAFRFHLSLFYNISVPAIAP